jgi:glycosyltransferase involved in cell wall biosynthesis
MKLAIISSRYPHPGSEAFLGTELAGLLPYFDRVIVVPVRSLLFARGTLIQALAAIVSHPRRFISLIATLFFARCTPAVWFKNLVVLPRGLAIAREIERERIDHIHAYWLSTPATVALIASQMTGIPWSSSAHRWDIYENNLIWPKARSARFLRVISERGNRDLGQMVGSAYASKVHKIHLGVAIPARAAIPRRQGPFRLLCAANLIAQKGHADLLDALRIVADGGVEYRCDVAGSGPLFAALQDRIAALHLRNRVFLRGRVDHHVLLESLRLGDYDAAILTSRADGDTPMEGIPVALIEAMAAGLPCVATASGSVPELVASDRGFLVPARDTGALAGAIALLASKSDLRERFGANARMHVSRHFNLSRTATQLAELIRTA